MFYSKWCLLCHSRGLVLWAYADDKLVSRNVVVLTTRVNIRIIMLVRLNLVTISKAMTLLKETGTNWILAMLRCILSAEGYNITMPLYLEIISENLDRCTFKNWVKRQSLNCLLVLCCLISIYISNFSRARPIFQLQNWNIVTKHVQFVHTASKCNAGCFNAAICCSNWNGNLCFQMNAR